MCIYICLYFNKRVQKKDKLRINWLDSDNTSLNDGKSEKTVRVP